MTTINSSATQQQQQVNIDNDNNDTKNDTTIFEQLDKLTSNQEDLLKVFEYTQLKILDPKNKKKLAALRGDDWYLPQISIASSETQSSVEPANDHKNTGSGTTDENAKTPPTFFSHSCDETGLKINCCGFILISSLNIASHLLRICLLILGWLLLWLALPRDLVEPGGAVFDLLSTFVVCFLVGGIAGRIVGIPPLLFVFLMGILWGNVGESVGYLVRGISLDVRTFVSRAALTVILLRSGLAMSWKTIEPAALNIITMSIFPLLIEVIIHGFVAGALLDYGDSSIWPFVQSMTASPSASAVVGATVLDMRARGYGITRGPGVLLVPSVVLDFTIGVWGINFIVELLFSDSSSGGELAWQIIRGPLQMVLGVVCGVILGLIWYYGVLKILMAESKAGSSVLDKDDEDDKKNRKDDDNHTSQVGIVFSRVSWHALFVLALMGACCVFGGYEGNFAGGGCLACTFLSATVHHMLTREATKKDNTLDDDENKSEENNQKGSPLHEKLLKNFLADQFARVWDWIFMPALFAFSGSAIKTSTMFEPEFAGRAIACLFIGAICRILVCTVCTWTFPMTRSERIISMIGSAGRGSAQVALGSYALTRVQEQPGGGSAEELKYGRQVYDTAELGVIILGTLSIVLISRIGPCFWLTDEEYEKREKEEQEEQQREPEQEMSSKKESDN